MCALLIVYRKRYTRIIQIYPFFIFNLQIEYKLNIYNNYSYYVCLPADLMQSQQSQQSQQTEHHNNGGENGNTVVLDLRVSCNTFYKYQMMLTVNRSDFTDNVNINEMNAGINCGDRVNKTQTFSRLERLLCDAMISHIHEDLAMNGEEEQIKKLCEISSKFHIHGHTTHSLLYHQSNAPHADHGGCIYICTHC